MGNYSRIAGRSALVTAAVALVMLAICTGVSGVKGLIAVLLAMALVAFFFGVSIVAVGRAARFSPQAMMLVAIATYLIKILILLILVGQFQDSTAFNGRLFGLTAIVCVIAYSVAQVVWSMRLKTLYVDPDGKR